MFKITFISLPKKFLCKYECSDYVIFQADTNVMNVYLYRLKLFKDSDEQFVVLKEIQICSVAVLIV